SRVDFFGDADQLNQWVCHQAVFVKARIPMISERFNPRLNLTKRTLALFESQCSKRIDSFVLNCWVAVAAIEPLVCAKDALVELYTNLAAIYVCIDYTNATCTIVVNRSWTAEKAVHQCLMFVASHRTDVHQEHRIDNSFIDRGGMLRISQPRRGDHCFEIGCGRNGSCHKHIG